MKMLTLVIKQSLPGGEKKVWRLRPDTKPKTFGSSRLADMISIDPLSKGIEGVFEYRKQEWWYIDLDRAHVADEKSPDTRISGNLNLKLNGSVLQLEVSDKGLSVFESPDEFTVSQAEGQLRTPSTLHIVKMGSTVLEMKVLPRGEKFTPQVALGPNIKLISKDVDLNDVSDLAMISPDQLIDKDSKKGAAVVLVSAFFLMGLGFFTPKKEIATELPKARATKVVVMTDLMRKKRGLPEAKQVEKKVAEKAPVPQKMPVATQASTKVAGMLKSFSANRISQMLGKVSAQAAKTENVIVTASGIKASPDQGGRALAAIGPITKPGKDWSKDAKGSAGVGVSTAGRGGGHGTGGLGALTSGATGSAGVGLIEDESEIVGGLDRDVIAQYIKTQLGQILYCYERQLSAHPEMEGKVSVRFVISGTGKVEEQKIGDTTLKNATVEGCILNRVAQWKFPTPQGGTKVVVTYPFLFKSTN